MARKSRSGAKAAGETPLRAALQPESALRSKVCDGIGAVDGKDVDFLAKEVRPEFADSLALDAALLKGHEQENRWDYLLGHAATSALVGVEQHSAKTDQISKVIAKKRAAQQQLRPHLQLGKNVRLWLWVSSGRVDFSPLDKANRRLAEAGIEFAGRQVQAKHLAKLEEP